ncbi:MAG: aminotransferase class I/II-fold pyridoxal phosphate-dependent enzyme [Gemmatimonadetes bacterium]|nr:aminotransferase class I/II-fold pyridoxal phosphate-dependent enzyme [Gemmatimonadota bacterium]MYG86060.1 aminotransferase class I/II-fold pyridoxal phosphate-dependent enzyme [Gemmatimonadota bacterium]MYJ90978.1 aminotransferase class I/II-fold pyridoxal phosphate-dependent enzyme [Gemmatimonadota bacterium]
MSTDNEAYRSIGLPPGIIRLSRNENPIGPSPSVIEAVKARCARINRYEDPDQIALFRKLAELHGVPHDEKLALPGAGSDGAWIRVGDGSEHLMHAMARAFLSPGDELIEPHPSFGLMSRYAEESGARAVRTPLTADYVYDLEAMAAAVNERTRMVVITNPNNPTGTIVTHDALSSFVAGLPERVMVLVDEAYADLAEDLACADGAGLAREFEYVLVVRTFSKGYGLAGFRFGYGVAQPRTMKRVRAFHGGSPSAMVLTAAIAALDDPDHVLRTRNAASASKAIYYEACEELGLEYVRSEAAFVLIAVGDAAAVTASLAERGILVINAEASWGLKGMIRVSYGNEQESRIFVEALREILS